jgi:hypothetical protein
MSLREKPSSVSPSLPGVMFPGFDLLSLIGEDVEIFLVHQPIEVAVDPLSIAVVFSQVFQSL